jgi:LysM repeat protein
MWSWAALVLGGLAFCGCVMQEKYEAEKARSLNFQRLLAQEEKRTGELDAELKKVKRDATDLDARNRELSAQVQAVREQMSKVQEDAAATIKAMERQRDGSAPISKPSAQAKRPKVEAPPPDLGIIESSTLSEVPAASGPAVYHTVKRGDTLYSIARRFKVDVGSLRSWNRLRGDQLEVGQRLIVGHE